MANHLGKIEKHSQKNCSLATRATYFGYLIKKW